MSPDTIEGIKICVSSLLTLGFALACAYVCWQVLTACDNIALIKRKLWDGEEREDE